MTVHGTTILRFQPSGREPISRQIPFVETATSPAPPRYRPTTTWARQARQAKNITLTAAAHHFGVWPGVISRIDRGLQRHDQLADHYRNWLTAVGQGSSSARIAVMRSRTSTTSAARAMRVRTRFDSACIAKT